MHDGGTGRSFDAKDDDPEPGIEPANAESGPAAKGFVGVGGEGSGFGVGRSHLTKHAHDEDDHEACSQVSHEDARAGLLNGSAGAYEQASSNDAGDGDHGEVTWLQGLGKLLVSVHGSAPSFRFGVGRSGVPLAT
ncbi:hypothetical protein D3C73_925980 [compost metagenome]